MRVNDSEEHKERVSPDVPSKDARAETLARTLRDAYYEWLEKHPRKT